jgi:glycosyltransferase involved in cell wall biosynthesis
LREILPKQSPHVIAVHHSDQSSDWTNSQIINQLDLIDEIVCVNEDTAKHIAAFGKPTHYIPNAIDPERIKPSGQQSALRALHGIPAGSKIVLFGHRLSAEKRPDLAVEIARQLPHDWVMVIVGDGHERPAVEAAAADCDRVRIVGSVESVADWLAISDCFLSLSTLEGFGLSICEAMAAGVPTVSTPAGIAPGLATTLPTDSTAAEWAAAIVTAKAKVQPAEILERFSVARMVSAWAGILKTIPQAKE